MYVIRIIVLKETYCCNSNLMVNIAAKMVMPKVTTLFDVTGCELVKKKTVADLVPADSYAVLILYFTWDFCILKELSIFTAITINSLE